MNRLQPTGLQLIQSLEHGIHRMLQPFLSGLNGLQLQRDRLQGFHPGLQVPIVPGGSGHPRLDLRADPLIPLLQLLVHEGCHLLLPLQWL